jgi:predicted ATPase
VRHHRVSRILIKGMRSIDDLELNLAEPTVLIGPNGAGKSTIIEACELLRKAGGERPFLARVTDDHGGAMALLRHGAKRLQLGVRLLSQHGIELGYDILLRSSGLRSSGAWLVIEREYAFMSEPGKPSRLLLERQMTDYRLPHPDARAAEHTVGIDDLALNIAALQSPEIEAIRAALASIEVHPALDTRAGWTAPGSNQGLRTSNIVRPVSRVEPGGRNLVNVYHALRDQPDWPETLARIRLALGERIENVTTPPDPSGGRIGLALRLSGIGEIPAFAMSDGQLAYLALLGVLRLKRPVIPSLVAFDEPDLHLHPGLVRRLTSDLELFGQGTTVVVATHSDALLDALTDPAHGVVLCDLDDRSATRCLRPDADELQRWLESYRGLGELRSAGYEEAIFPALETQ